MMKNSYFTLVIVVSIFIIASCNKRDIIFEGYGMKHSRFNAKLTLYSDSTYKVDYDLFFSKEEEQGKFTITNENRAVKLLDSARFFSNEFSGAAIYLLDDLEIIIGNNNYILVRQFI